MIRPCMIRPRGYQYGFEHFLSNIRTELNEFSLVLYDEGLGNCNISFATVHDLLGYIPLTAASVLYISHRFVIRQHRDSLNGFN